SSSGLPCCISLLVLRPFSLSWTFVLHLRIALLAIPCAAALRAVLAGARGLAAARADHLEVGDLDGSLALQDAPLNVALRIGAGVLLAEVHPLHDGRPLGRIHAQHLALLASVLPRQHDHGVVLLHVRLEVRLFFLAVRSSVHQMTSGANEMIFMNLRSRSSRATGPKTRVPTGSLASLISTAALSSNLMYEPSRRRLSFTVRTMTALTTAPFFTVPSGEASFTEAVMTSPSRA